MVLIEQYHQIVERKTSQVSSLWKILHVTNFLIAAASGFITCFTFGGLSRSFGYNCVLFADLAFTKVGLEILSTTTPMSNITTNTTDENITNTTLRTILMTFQELRKDRIDMTHTTWGEDNLCYFVQYTPLISMISAIVWGMFFMIMSRGGAGYPSDIISQPWRVVYPALLFSILFFIILLSSLLRMAKGFKMFCDQFYPILKNDQCVQEINWFTLDFNPTMQPFYECFKVASFFAHLGLFAWAFQIVVLIFRIIFIVDYKLYVVTVEEKEKEILDDSTFNSVSEEEIGSNNTVQFSISSKGSMDSKLTRDSKSKLSKNSKSSKISKKSSKRMGKEATTQV